MERDKLIEQILGYSGRMVAGSKGRYKNNNPDHLVVFNGNILIGGTKVWYGDMNLSSTEDICKMRSLATLLGEEVHLLSEMDARFGLEDTPNINDYILKVSSNSVLDLGEKTKKYAAYDERKCAFFLKEDFVPKPISIDTLHEDVGYVSTVNFEDVIFTKFNLNIDTENVSKDLPYMDFYAPIAKGLNIPLSTLEANRVVITEKTAKNLKKAVVNYLSKELSGDEYSVRKELGWLDLSYSPRVVVADKNFKDNAVYVLKEDK